jgi:hypothetical protein
MAWSARELLQMSSIGVASSKDPRPAQARHRRKDNQMITITEGAAQLLTHIQGSLESASTLRVVLEDDELVIGRSEGAPDDEVYFHEGEPILRLAADAAKALADCTVGTEKTTEGTTLAILPSSVA